MTQKEIKERHKNLLCDLIQYIKDKNLSLHARIYTNDHMYSVDNLIKGKKIKTGNLEYYDNGAANPLEISKTADVKGLTLQMGDRLRDAYNFGFYAETTEKDIQNICKKYNMTLNQEYIHILEFQNKSA